MMLISVHKPTAQMIGILAHLECAGVGCDPSVLLSHKATICRRLQVISQRAVQLAGHPFNVSSSSQLAVVLYDELKLPLPNSTGELPVKIYIMVSL